MTTKGSDKKQWTDPKDFGLPWVEIKPLHAKPKSTGNPVESIKDQELSTSFTAREEKLTSHAFPEKKKNKKVTEITSKSSLETPIQVKKKETPSWAWLVFVLFAAVFGILVWQILKQTRQTDSPASSIPTAAQETKPAASPDQVQPESTSAEPIQTPEIEVDKESSPQVFQNNIPVSQSGTTIAQDITGNLIRVESQAERPQYFIIVGSVPSEADALKLIPYFQAKVPEVYLISPYSESKNYRVAIGKFTSFRAAAEELDKIKSQHSEELWILKY